MPRSQVSDKRPTKSPDVVRDYVQGFGSGELDEPAIRLVRKAALRGRPQTIREARDRLIPLVDLTFFLGRRGMQISASTRVERLFTDPALAAWEQDLRRRVETGELSDGTARTYFSRVRRLGILIGMRGAFLHSRGHSHRQDVEPPMPDAEFGQWELAAGAQSPVMSVRLRGHLYMCRGAGLGTTDERYVRGYHIVRQRDGAVVIHVHGPNGRDAVVLDRYADSLLEVAVRFRDELIVGEWPHRNNPASDLLDNIKGGQDLARPLPSRLRRAYVVEMLCSDVGVITLKNQLGCKSLSELEAAIPFAVGRMPNRRLLRHGAPAGEPMVWDLTPLRRGDPA